MLLRLYLYLLFSLTLIFWAVFAFIIFYVNPLKTDTFGLIAFFVSLFSVLLGTFTLFSFYLRLKFSKKEAIFSHFLTSLRQGALFSIFILGIFGFLAMKILTWWTASLYFAIIVLVELIIRSK